MQRGFDVGEPQTPVCHYAVTQNGSSSMLLFGMLLHIKLHMPEAPMFLEPRGAL